MEKGWRIPITNKVVVSESLFLNIIDQMRISLPRELQEAQELLRARDQFIARAQEDAKQIMLQAQEDAASQLDEFGLQELAQQQARRIVDEAWQTAAEIRAGADEYAETQLRELGRSAADLLRTVRNGLEYLERRRAEHAPHDEETGEAGEDGSQAAAETADYDGEAEEQPYEPYEDGDEEV
ncbi:MAG: hypothetical protein GX657_14090 [Chloroflexi bacterium]|nr:hypothetical protein [Chloroflexota bacterium]